MKKIGSVFCATVLTLIVPAPLSLAQKRQIPFVTATTVRWGATISHNHSTRIAGDVESYNSFQKTDGIRAVNVQLRTLGRLASPYEVQSFFCARDAKNKRFVYAAMKVISAQEFDDITFVAQKLFFGSERKNITIATSYGHDSYGESVTLTRTSIDKTIVRGSNIEGWIVRIVSAGQIVREEASVPELKDFADNDRLLLSRIASQTKLTEPVQFR